MKITPNKQLLRSILTKFSSFAFLCFAAFSTQTLTADCIGKVELGPTYLHLDILESGKTIKRVDMPAIRVDSNVMVWKGVCVKPSILYGQNGDTKTFTCGLGIGHVFKVNDKLCITPSIGCTYGQFRTTLHAQITKDVRLSLKEKFYSISPYGSIDISYTICKGLRLCGIYQYVWSDTHTTITNDMLPKSTTTSHPTGQNYALILEKDINESWSVNIAGAYNDSLTKEKHGIRAFGARIAAAYWF